MKGRPIDILLVEDDPAHAEIVRRNFEQSKLANRLIHLPDGEQALDYLLHRGAYADPPPPRPGLLLLDLRLPRIDGMEVLAAVKSDPDLASIPVVILTTSSAETDIVKAYDHHANSYLVKPVDFNQLTSLMQAVGYYWLAWNEYPFDPERPTV